MTRRPRTLVNAARYPRDDRLDHRRPRFALEELRAEFPNVSGAGVTRLLDQIGVMNIIARTGATRSTMIGT